MHKTVNVTKDELEKAQVITFDDRAKGGLDIIHIIAGTYTLKFSFRQCIAANTSTCINDTEHLATVLYPTEEIQEIHFS